MTFCFKFSTWPTPFGTPSCKKNPLRRCWPRSCNDWTYQDAPLDERAMRYAVFFGVRLSHPIFLPSMKLTYHFTWKWMVGRPTFLLGWPMFTGYVSFFRCFWECRQLHFFTWKFCGKTAGSKLREILRFWWLWLYDQSMQFLLMFLPLGRSIRSYLWDNAAAVFFRESLRELNPDLYFRIVLGLLKRW